MSFSAQTNQRQVEPAGARIQINGAFNNVAIARELRLGRADPDR